MHRARQRAIESASIPLITAFCLVGCSLTAQAPQPFHPAVADAHFTLSPEFAALDVNRDGAVDVVSPGLFFGARISTLDEHGRTLGQFNDSCAVAANPRSASVPRPLTLTSGDLDRDGQVSTTDFLLLLAAWGPNPGHPADLDGSGGVDTADFLALLAAWGPCP